MAGESNGETKGEAVAGDTIKESTTSKTSKGSPAEQLEELIAQATAKYAVKDYRSAAEYYSRATELQAEINGEMSPQNADLLYAYGRCLYHVAVLNSEVLGSKLAGESKDAPPSKSAKAGGSSSKTAAAPAAAAALPAVTQAESAKTQELVTAVVEEKAAAADKANDDESAASKPYFVFTGDEGYDESDDEEEGDDAEAEGEAGADDQEEEEDDFSNAFEVLDLARVLLQRQVEEKQSGSDKSALRPIEERLADTYDLQAEISLEGEQFHNAATDLRASLEMKRSLYGFESSLVAEAHYKLSLALEFAAVTHHVDANGEVDASKPATVNQKMRDEAAEQMEQAIASCRQRIAVEEAKLAEVESAGANGNGSGSGAGKITRQSIDDVKEMVEDMQQRVSSCLRSQCAFSLHLPSPSV